MQLDLICVNCSKINNIDAEYCINCDRPLDISNRSDLIEFEQIENEKVQTEKQVKPKSLEVIVSWIIFFPILMICCFFAYDLITGGLGGGFIPFVLFWAVVLLGFVCVKLLYKTTTNYYVLPKFWDNNDDV